MKVLNPITKAVEMFKSMPGIGPRMAERLAYYIIKKPKEFSNDFAESIVKLKESIKHCSICWNFTDSEKCSICEDDLRNNSLICVVEDVHDLLAVEKTGYFKGVYHVLHGSLSPLDGIGPDDLTIQDLMERVQKGGVGEIILATNPNVEGEATATYISGLLKHYKIKITKLAQGMPRGGAIEYVDGITLKRAFEERKEI